MIDYLEVSVEIIEHLRQIHYPSFYALVNFTIDSGYDDWLEVLLNKTEFFVAYIDSNLADE